MVRSIALFVLLLFIPLSSDARDWTVPSEVATVEEAIAAAAAGDRILVLPGEYAVSAALPAGTALTLIGRDGAGATTFRGADPKRPILTVGGSGGEDLSVRGITFDRRSEEATFCLSVGRRNVRIEACAFLGGAGVFLDSCEGLVRANRFDDSFDAMRILRSPVRIEENRISGARQYAILCRASAAEIFRNRFERIASSCIVVVGKRFHPVIGGSPGKGNVFLNNDYLLVANESRNDIDARYNYWGPVVTSTMDRLGYPANLDEFQDKEDSEDRANGRIDYRNWLHDEGEIGRGRFPLLPIAATAVLVVVVIGLAARRWCRRRPATA